VAAVDPATGEVLWKYSHACKIPIPNLTAMGGDRFFVTGAYGAGSAVIKVSRAGGSWAAKELARNDQIGGHCHPALFWKEHLYILCNVNERADGMVCFDADAKVVWQTKNAPNLDKGGSILTADGIIYLVDGKTGELHVIEPSPEGFHSLAKAKLLEGREIWGPLALAGNYLVIRDQTQMKCVDLRQAAGE
jgi:outer membrane protein assembly factor BamB